MAYFVLSNVLLIISVKSILIHLIPPRHKIAKTVEKLAKIALLWAQFSRDWVRTRLYLTFIIMNKILTKYEITKFKEDGAIFLKNKFDINWINKLKTGIEKDISNPSP